MRLSLKKPNTPKAKQKVVVPAESEARHGRPADPLGAPSRRIALRLPNVVSFFSAKHPIASIAIVGGALEAVVLRERVDTKQPEVAAHIQAPLPQGTIIDGTLVNPQAFTIALSRLRARAKTPFCIFSFPSEGWWSRLFFFPAALTNAQFEEAMRFHKSLDLPWDEKAVYADWEEVPSLEVDKRAGLIVAASQKGVDAFADALTRAGWTTLAIEPSAFSIVRAIHHFEGEQSALVFGFDGSLVEESIMWKGSLRFGRVIALGPDYVEQELRRLLSYALTEPLSMPRPTHIYFVGSFTQEQLAKFVAIANAAGLQEKNFAISSLPWGAALRGLIPRERDTFISLTSVGTEDAYQRRRAALFAELAMNFAFLVAFMLTIVYAGTWIFLRSQANDTAARLAQRQGTSAGLQQALDGMREFNTISGTAAAAARATPRWDKVYAQLREAARDGIRITRLAISAGGAVQLEGVAETPQALLTFRDRLQAKGLGKDIRIAPNLFEESANINFPLNFSFETALLFD